jgi:hypothetical protein
MSNKAEDDHNTVTATSTESVSLMKLPAELRKNIYGHYFADTKEAQWFLRPVLNLKPLGPRDTCPRQKSTSKY